MSPGPRSLLTSARLRCRMREAMAVAASLAVHVGFLGPLAATALLLRGPPPRLAVGFVPLSSDQWAVNRRLSGATVVPEPPPFRFIELPPDTERDPLREHVAPSPSARHLAERNQRVADERVSRDAGVLDELLRVVQREFEGIEGSGERGREVFSAKGREGARGGGGRPDAPRHWRAPVPDAAEEPGSPAPSAETDPPPAPRTPTLVPQPGADGGKRIIGQRYPGRPMREFPRPEGGPNYDGLGELREGDETRIDAHEVGTAPFWIDVRNRIEQEWQRRAVEIFRRVDPREDVYFYKTRTAVLKVRLGVAGELKNVDVVESSTLPFFDDVAMDAIRAGTYPPPPPEALAGGEASIRVRITWLPSLRPQGLR